MRKKIRFKVLIFCVVFLLVWGGSFIAFSQPKPPIPPLPLPRVTIGVDRASTPGDVALTLQILALLTILALAPSIVMLLTSFTRTLIVLSFIRSAMGLQQTPPNQVIIGVALFITMFVMSPVWIKINNNALQPFLREEISAQEAWNNTIQPLRDFMFKQTRDKELSLMVSLAGLKRPKNRSEVPTYVLIPAFVLSELKTAFQMGVLIYIPFIVVDMVVASTLMSMGMIMLPPMLVSLPFKVLLFVLVDGWDLVIYSLISSFKF